MRWRHANFSAMMPRDERIFPVIRTFFLTGLLVFSVFPLRAEENPQSHRAIYDISLHSTAGGAAGVVNAKGKMSYRIQKVCGVWETESVFSLNVGYESTGADTTNWRQVTRESMDGCLFDFAVHVREKGVDRKDLQGGAVCRGGKKSLRLDFPVKSVAVLPKSVVFPVQQTMRLLSAAKSGKKSVSSYVYDGTRPESLYSVHAAVSPVTGFRSAKVEGDAELLKNVRVWRFDTAFFDAFALKSPSDGSPRYEVSMYVYENGVGDRIVQDFGTHRLLSEMTRLERLPDLPCPPKAEGNL